MTISLYRVINSGDQFNPTQQLVANNLISYNSGTNVNIHAPFITSYRIANTTGIGNNQAAEQDLGDHQDLGPVEQLYILTGYITIRGTAVAPNNLITIMKKWDDEPKTNTNFIHGQMGIDFDDNPNYNIIPVGTGSNQVGLIWKSLDWNPIDFIKHPLRADFEIRLIVDKGDDQ